jgi:uncharacterized membrane protein
MGLAQRLRDSFVAGLILVAPLVVTVAILKILATWSLQLIDPVVAGTQLTTATANNELAAQVVAALLIIVLVTVVGLVAQYSVGRQLFGNLGRGVTLVPLVSTIYASVRQVASSLVDSDSEYDSVVLVEYPRKNVYAIGLVTGTGRESIDAVAGEQVYSVFLPNSPNPTAGRLVMLPASEIHETDMSVRDGMGMIVTTGMGEPEERLAAQGVPMDAEAAGGT